MTSIAVTGASGALGRRLVDRLLEDPTVERVVAIDRRSFPRPADVDPDRLVSLRLDVAVDDAGTIYAVFPQDQGSGLRLWHTRSTDGGLTFSTEADIGAGAGLSNPRGVDMEVASEEATAGSVMA